MTNPKAVNGKVDGNTVVPIKLATACAIVVAGAVIRFELAVSGFAIEQRHQGESLDRIVRRVEQIYNENWTHDDMKSWIANLQKMNSELDLPEIK